MCDSKDIAWCLYKTISNLVEMIHKVMLYF
jgi:hypothetical protein